MQEYQCRNCGYRKMEPGFMEMMADLSMYSGFGAGLASGFMPTFTSDVKWQEDMVCPNCQKASGWVPTDEE